MVDSFFFFYQFYRLDKSFFGGEEFFYKWFFVIYKDGLSLDKVIFCYSLFERY